MSDVSQLTYEYHRESALSERLNRGLIVLHKARLGGAGTAPAEVAAGGLDLAAIIDDLLALLRPADGRGAPGVVAARGPGALVARVQAERSGDLAYYAQDLERVAARLRDRPGAVTADDLALLDGLAAAADAEASRVFRRLMRV